MSDKNFPHQDEVLPSFVGHPAPRRHNHDAFRGSAAAQTFHQSSGAQRLVLPAALPQSVCQTAVSTEQPVPAQSNLPETPPFTVHFHFLATTALSLSAPLTSPPHERHARTLRQQLP